MFGATELQCWPTWGTTTSTVPADTREVLLRDDRASAPVGELVGVEDAVDLVASASLVCALTREGRVLCGNAQSEPLEPPSGW